MLCSVYCVYVGGGEKSGSWKKFDCLMASPDQGSLKLGGLRNPPKLGEVSEWIGNISMSAPPLNEHSTIIQLPCGNTRYKYLLSICPSKNSAPASSVSLQNQADLTAVEKENRHLLFKAVSRERVREVQQPKTISQNFTPQIRHPFTIVPLLCSYCRA